MDMKQVERLKLLISRLERLSADSYWAHQASGIRGSLLHWLERLEMNQDNPTPVPGEEPYEQIEELLNRGYYLLQRAAREHWKKKR